MKLFDYFLGMGSNNIDGFIDVTGLYEINTDKGKLYLEGCVSENCADFKLYNEDLTKKIASYYGDQSEYYDDDKDDNNENDDYNDNEDDYNDIDEDYNDEEDEDDFSNDDYEELSGMEQAYDILCELDGYLEKKYLIKSIESVSQDIYDKWAQNWA